MYNIDRHILHLGPVFPQQINLPLLTDDLIDELPVENDIWVNLSLSAGFNAGLN